MRFVSTRMTPPLFIVYESSLKMTYHISLDLNPNEDQWETAFPTTIVKTTFEVISFGRRVFRLSVQFQRFNAKAH